MGLPTRMLPMGRKTELPYDAEVEYLESTGSQYMLFSNGVVTGIDVWVRPQSTGAVTPGAVGNWNNGSKANTIRFQTVQSRRFSVTNYDNNYVYTGLSYAYRHVTVRGENITIDGSAFTMGSAWRYYTPFALFGCWNGSTQIVDTQSCRIGPCKLFVGSTVTHDFQPVRFTNEQGQSEGAMYDRANPTAGMNPDGSARNDGIYRNQGTGAFVVGADK